MNKTPHSFYIVRFTDCDLFAHLNNARYLDYFLNAREDHLREAYQLDLSGFYQQGVGWVVAGHEISYIRPAAYNERVFITSSIIEITPDSLLVEMIMMNEAQNHIKSFLWTKFIHVNVKTSKKETHTDSFMEFAESVTLKDVDVSKGYQRRLKEIIKKAKQQQESALPE